MKGWQSNALPDRVLVKVRAEDRKRMGKAGVTSAEAQEAADLKSERELQNQIENWFRLNGIPAFRQRMDRKSNMPIGTPDFLVCYKGRFIALECKVGNNEPTIEQMNCLTAIHKAGGTCEVIRCLQDVKKLLLGQPF